MKWSAGAVFLAAAAAALCAALAAFWLSRLAGLGGGESTVEQPTSFDAKLRPAPTAGS
jgi:MFS transporter, AAHS family, 4-hydroxybenzoate transporter